MKKLATGAVAIVALTCAGSLRAHHSLSMFDISTSIWVKGTVVRYEPVSPHAMIELEQMKEGGQVQRWTIEGPFPGRLNRILSHNGMAVSRDFLRVGDVIEVCGFALKQESQRLYSGTERSSAEFVHGHVLVMPDGRMQSWGPYGKIDNCVRPNDQAQPWANFLNTDPLAREFWCGNQGVVKGGTTVPKALVDEIDSLMTHPCD
jgi:hypothetical protein